ncbi:MAG: hypothetical protein V3W00_04830 [Candidatus Brocadiales bacterium]
MARTTRDNKEQSKRFDKKITFELEPRTNRLEQAVKELARRLPR